MLLRGILADRVRHHRPAGTGCGPYWHCDRLRRYAFVDGMFTIVHAIRERSTLEAWGWLLFQGIVAIIAGDAHRDPAGRDRESSVGWSCLDRA